MTARLFVLKTPENQGVVDVAEGDPSISVVPVGPYFSISAPSTIVIDRRATGCRHAVWYSAVAGLDQSVITQHDKDALRVEAR
ncbi:hypothetical protein [Subtercola lobariae]|uniref:Uncharacterized protein n=1 Tax=Subtercola lobariae TaxID=1588641 RepID=A0A917BAK3_9MICO|nr:hypothetical protein [Subtercola lobariae]GGF33990.1 hypothetical protein GCM10011399_28950 [Subtercola lobariae]